MERAHTHTHPVTQSAMTGRAGMVVGGTPKPQEGVGPRPGRLTERVNCRGAPPGRGPPQ